MNNYTWDSTFLELFDRCTARYRSGDEDFANYYDDASQAFLTSIGYKPREFFDFVEDHVDGDGTPSVGTALLIASARRDYLSEVMNGTLSDHEIQPSELPGKTEELGGFVWLPRIIVKARGKLRGELDPDIMFGCGGDRGFCRKNNLAPADFLRAVWASDGDDQAILDYVRRQAV